jgi:hypothetical protein
MQTFFCVMAWPDGGTAEMMVEACETMTAAQACRRQKETRYPAWRFRIAEMVR